MERLGQVYRIQLWAPTRWGVVAKGKPESSRSLKFQHNSWWFFINGGISAEIDVISVNMP